MDILLRLLTTIDNQEMKTRVLEWLKQINIIEKLVELLHFNYTNVVQSNASQVLCDIIRISREQLLSNNENNLQLTSLAINKQNDNEENKTEENFKDPRMKPSCSFNCFCVFLLVFGSGKLK